jgi:hypothetical protein
MLLLMADISDTRPPEIWETADDKLLSVNKLKEKNVEYARTHFIKTPHLVIENQETKWKIEITSQVIKEWRHKSRTRPRIMAIRLLDVMIKTAIMGITACPFRFAHLNITVSGYRLPTISHNPPLLSSRKSSSNHSFPLH